MRILGLDVGEQRIGVALSDPLGWTAQGLCTLERSQEEEKDVNRLNQIIKEYEVEKVVVGLPKNMNGSLGPQAQKVQDFAQKLEAVCGVAVIFWDERLSTVLAKRTLLDADVSRKKRKRVIDKMAAVVILQSYLDSQSMN